MRATQFVGFKLPSTQYQGKSRNDYRSGKPIKIVPKFLPKGWRFLRPKEEVERTDFFWSKKNGSYLPAYQKYAWRGLAGHVVLFIRRVA